MLYQVEVMYEVQVMYEIEAMFDVKVMKYDVEECCGSGESVHCTLNATPVYFISFRT